MALDDEAYNNESAASFLRALREHSGVKSRRAIIKGYTYSTGHFFDTVANGETVNVFIENPVGSGKVIFPWSTFRSSGEIRFNKVDTVTVDTAGTDLAINNRRLDNGISAANAEHSVVFSGGNVWTEKVSGGAQQGGGLAPGVASDYELVLQEGENVIYQATNTSGGKSRITIDIDYTEMSRNEINEFSE